MPRVDLETFKEKKTEHKKKKHNILYCLLTSNLKSYRNRVLPQKNKNTENYVVMKNCSVPGFYIYILTLSY